MHPLYNQHTASRFWYLWAFTKTIFIKAFPHTTVLYWFLTARIPFALPWAWHAPHIIYSFYNFLNFPNYTIIPLEKRSLQDRKPKVLLDKICQTTDLWPPFNLERTGSSDEYFRHAIRRTTTFHWDTYDEHSINCHFNQLPKNSPTSIIIIPNFNVTDKIELNIRTKIDARRQSYLNIPTLLDNGNTHEYYKLEISDDATAILIDKVNIANPTLVIISSPDPSLIKHSSREALSKSIVNTPTLEDLDLREILEKAPNRQEIKTKIPQLIIENGIACGNPWSQNAQEVHSLSTNFLAPRSNEGLSSAPQISTTWDISETNRNEKIITDIANLINELIDNICYS